MSILDKLRKQLADKLDERAAQHKVQTDVVERAKADNDRDLTEVEAAEFRAAADKKKELDAEVDVLSARVAEIEDEERRDEAAAKLRRDLGDTNVTASRSPATVTSEERTYTAETARRDKRSFFVDAYRAEFSTDYDARARLERHAREAKVEREQRAASSGSFAGLVVPQYLTDLYAPVARAGRPLANAVRHLELPDSGMSLVVPRGTTGATAASQATENTAVSNTDEVWANLQPPVVTVAGQQDVSRQSLERGAMIDEIVYADLAGAYAAELDRQLINGSGAANQMLGILQTSGIYTATAFGAAPTMASINLKTAGGIGSVAGAGTIVAPANLILMHPRRWAFLCGQSDSSGRPAITPEGAGPQNAAGVIIAPGEYSTGDAAGTTFTIVGYYQGLPVVLDANVPTNVGTNSEDVIVPMNRLHALLWEDGDGAPRELRFEQTLGSQLTVKLVVYGYAAFTAGRYPLAFARIGGADSVASQGLVAPSF